MSAKEKSEARKEMSGEEKSEVIKEIISAGAKWEKSDTVPKPPKKPSASGYFLFANRYRPEFQELNPGKAAGVIAKLVGEKWRLLLPSEKEIWNTKCNELKDKYKEQLAEYEREHGKIAAAKRLTILPTHKIRKIVRLNNTVRKITPEALAVLTRATELFLEGMGTDCAVLAKKLDLMSTDEKVFSKQVHVMSKYEFLRSSFKRLPDPKPRISGSKSTSSPAPSSQGSQRSEKRPNKKVKKVKEALPQPGMKSLKSLWGSNAG